MTDTAQALPQIPGLDMVGRGVYLRPQQPFELKEVLFRHADHQRYPSKEIGETYLVPAGYEVNDSPPMPAAQARNQIMIKASRERVEKQTSRDLAAAIGNGPFSVDVNASQTAQLRSEEEPYYALRNSFIPSRPASRPASRGSAQSPRAAAPRAPRKSCKTIPKCTVFGKGGNALSTPR